MISKVGKIGGKSLSIITMSRDEIQSMKKPEEPIPHVVISICCPCETLVSINSGALDILRLRFQDLDETEDPRDVLFSSREAIAASAFVKMWLSRVEAIVIHCGAGVSRSVGLAAALSKVLFGNDDEFFQKGVPNRLVYRIALETFMGEFSDAEQPTNS
jgi:predicted protein tyrosine phosphatase